MKYYDPVVDKNRHLGLILKAMLLVFVVLYFTSCANIFSELGSKTREPGLVKQIEITMNSDPDAALVLFQALPPSVSVKRENQILLATIYAQICGQDFFNITEALGGAEPTLFLNMMSNFDGVTGAEADSCLLARDTIQGIDPSAANRTVSENILMAYISWSTFGAINHLVADTDDDRSVDAGFNACLVGSVTDAQVASIGVAINEMIDSLANTSGNSGTGSTELDLFDTICPDPPAPSPNFCGITDQATMEADPAAINEVRAIIKSDQGVGLAQCPLCACP